MTANTIACSNPICGKSISIPTGSSQVICTACNTWHFIDAEKESESIVQNSVSSGGFALPPNIDVVEQNDQDLLVPPAAYEDNQVITHDNADIVKQIEKKEPACLLAESGERLKLKEGKNIIGRQDTDVVIDSRTISRRHCVIDVTEIDPGTNQYTVYDIGHIEGRSSTNGVFIKGRSQRLKDFERIDISNGDSIILGKIKLTLQSE